ncbi:MAG: metal-dependent hydrolase [archaeon]
MNWFNHFFFSLNLLLVFFKGEVSLSTMILFTVIFALLVDVDILIKLFIFKSKEKDLKTWTQEPFGVILIGLPAGLILQYLYGPPYLALVLIPYISHIFLDYITVHNVFPLAPFSKKMVKTGFIKPKLWLKDLIDFSSLNENYVLVLNLIVFVFLMIS